MELPPLDRLKHELAEARREIKTMQAQINQLQADKAELQECVAMGRARLWELLAKQDAKIPKKRNRDYAAMWNGVKP